MRTRRSRLFAVAVAALAVIGVAIVLVLVTAPSAPNPNVARGQGPASQAVGGTSIAPVRSVVPAATPDVDIPYTIFNLADQAKTYELSAIELDENGAVISASTGGAGHWISFDSPTVTVPAKASATVDVHVHAPTNRGVEERRVGVSIAEAPPSSSAGIGVHVKVTTSVYVQGTGVPIRKASLDGLDMPSFATGPFAVRTLLVNDGTVTVVPGAVEGTAAGTISGGTAFALTGDPVKPASSGELQGTVSDVPAFCWCQIKAAVDNGAGGASVVEGRVLVAPLWAVVGIPTVLAAGAVVLALRRAQRRTAATR